MSEQHLALEFERALLSLDRTTASRLFVKAQNGSPIQLVEDLVVPALQRIGLAWEEGRIALSQVYMSGRICEELVSAALPEGLPTTDRPGAGRMAIAVLEDYHVLGKRIVYSLLRASGFDLADYGPGLPAAEIARRARADRLETILISTLMLRSALKVKELRELLGSDVGIVVGGAPFRFDPLLWREVGADAFGRTAADAVNIVAHLAEARR